MSNRQQDEVFIFFDLGNVIANFDHEIAISRLAEISSTSVDEVRKVFFRSDLQAQYEKGELNTEAVYESFCEHAQESPTYNFFVSAISEIFWLNQAIVPLLSKLFRENYRLGILSNTCTAHWEYLVDRYTVLNTLFHCHVLSFEVHSAKPNREIYQQAEKIARERTGFRGSTFFFVDDLPANVQGALDAGWQACVYSSPQDVLDHLNRF